MNTSKLKRIAGIIPSIALCTMMHLGAQAANTCNIGNLWVNGTFENLTVGNQCNIFNPVNAYSATAPFFGFTTFTWEAGLSLQPTYVNEATEDHTTAAAGGHYLYVDPRDNGGITSQVKQSIKVKNGTTYTFSAWVCSMLRSSYVTDPAVVQLWVNGTAVSSTLTLNSLSVNGWTLLSGTWTASSTGYVDVEITDLDPIVTGHDFAIDDIYFGDGTLDVDAGKDFTVCANTPFTLGGSPTADFGATCSGSYTYLWTPVAGLTSANTIANPTGIQGSPGSYTYTVQVTDVEGNTCADDVKVTVEGCNDPKKCAVDNLWVNPTWEDLAVDNHCNIFNPINGYIAAPPYYGFTTFTWEAGTFLQPTYVNEATIDHTTGAAGGHYLYVDPRANTGATSQVKQSIKVVSGTTYTFSAWFCSMLKSSYSASPAVVELYVNGASVSSTLTLNSLSLNGWIQLSGTWTASSTGYVDAEIIDWSPVVGGHDFAVDDVYFGQGIILADAGHDATICAGTTHHLGGAPTADFGATCFGEYTYNWSPTTGFITPSNIANPDINLLSPGVYTYTVIIKDLNGQVCSDDVTITVKDCKGDGGKRRGILPGMESRVYPNPTNGMLTFEGLPATASNIIIYSMSGQIQLNNTVNTNNVTLDISHLPYGLYYYVITDNAGKALERNKITKQ